jgi:hypothetical protein
MLKTEDILLQALAVFRYPLLVARAVFQKNVDTPFEINAPVISVCMTAYTESSGKAPAFFGHLFPPSGGGLFHGI